MAITAPAFVMKYPYLRKRTRDLFCFWKQVRYGSRFVASRMGYKLLFDLDGVVDRYVLAFNFYERDQREALFTSARELTKTDAPKVFLDIGSHWGIYALWAHSSGLFDKIVAVEADPRNAAQLHANLYLNDLTSAVDVVEAAAAGETGALSFSLEEQRGRVGSRLSKLGHRDGMRTISVPAVRLDDLSTVRDGVVVAKIDVEGAETDVIDGMRDLLANNKCLLQVEVFDNALAPFDVLMDTFGCRRVSSVGADRYYQNY